ncbi:MAG: alpha/beta fold hydrolase [Dehalococcoidia bacterium]
MKRDHTAMETTEKPVEFESRWIRVGEANIHYLVGGEGTPLVLLHGSGGGAENEWGPNLEIMARNFRIYAPDLVGFGKSDKPTTNYNQRFLKDFFTEFVEAMGLERINLMGHSLGGGVALAFAFDHPGKVENLVLVGSSGLSTKTGFLGKLLIPLFGLYAKLAGNHSFASIVERGDDSEAWEIFMDRLPELITPTLLLWGERDGYMPVKLAHQAHERLPNSRLHVFEKCWHAPQRARTEEFNSLVLNFLKE